MGERVLVTMEQAREIFARHKVHLSDAELAQACRAVEDLAHILLRGDRAGESEQPAPGPTKEPKAKRQRV